MEDPEEAARGELRAVTALMQEADRRLTRTHDLLPVSPREEMMLEGEEDWDFSVEVRTAIECDLHQHIRPLIKRLKKLADYQPGGEGE